MPRTTLSKTTLPGGSSSGVGFNEFPWTAADAGNFNAFASTGKEMLMIRNVNADSPVVSYTVTLHKVAGRIEITLGSGEYACTGQIPMAGWKQTSDSNVWVDAPNAEIEFAVLVLP